MWAVDILEMIHVVRELEKEWWVEIHKGGPEAHQWDEKANTEQIALSISKSELFIDFLLSPFSQYKDIK